MNQATVSLAFIATLGFFSSSFVSVAQADQASLAEHENFYRLRPAVVREVVPTVEELYSDLGEQSLRPNNKPEEGAPREGFTIDWDTMRAIGEKVLQIIQAGRPVVNVTRDVVHVVPGGITTWNQLSGWRSPVTKVYSVTATNYLGITVVDLRLKVSANFSGNFDGRGQYIANAIIVPSSIYVMWGFNCDVWAERRDPVNLGSRDNPVAGLGFDIRYRFGNMINEQIGTQDYFLSGAGEIQQLH